MDNIKIENFIVDSPEGGEKLMSYTFRSSKFKRGLFIIIFLISSVLLLLSVGLVFNTKLELRRINSESLSLKAQLIEEENKVTEAMRLIEREEKTMDILHSDNKNKQSLIDQLSIQKAKVNEEMVKAEHENYNLWTQTGGLDKKLYGYLD